MKRLKWWEVDHLQNSSQNKWFSIHHYFSLKDVSHHHHYHALQSKDSSFSLFSFPVFFTFIDKLTNLFKVEPLLSYKIADINIVIIHKQHYLDVNALISVNLSLNYLWKEKVWKFENFRLHQRVVKLIDWKFWPLWVKSICFIIKVNLRILFLRFIFSFFFKLWLSLVYESRLLNLNLKLIATVSKGEIRIFGFSIWIFIQIPVHFLSMDD